MPSGNKDWKPGQKVPGSKQFQKGHPGGPGRPKLPDLNEAMANILGEEKDGVTALELILKQVRAKAAKGDIRAVELLLDRGFGKAKQIMDIEMDTKITEIKVEINTSGSNDQQDKGEGQAGQPVQ